MPKKKFNFLIFLIKESPKKAGFFALGFARFRTRALLVAK
jgi:hypothetical protein